MAFGPLDFALQWTSAVTTTLTFNSQTLPFRKDFAIAGANCLLSTNSPEVLQATVRSQTESASGNAFSFEMEVIVRADMDATPERLPHFRGLRHIVFANLPPCSFLTYDLLRKRVYAVLSSSAARDPSFWHTLLLPITIGVLGTTIGIAPLHSACLDRNGSGILVAGLSGVGKSTLATALAQAGFALISDDWTYLSRQQSALLAHGLSSPVKLLPDAARFFPQLRSLIPKPALNGELAYEIDPKQWKGFTVKTTTVPRHIFFLERASTPGCHVIPSRPEYLRDFFEKSGERLPNEIAEARTFRTELIGTLSNCPSWILRTGDNPQITAEVLSDFLAENNRATA